MPTTLHWKAKGVTIKQDCLWPAQHSAIKIVEGEGDFSLKLRVPYWATQGFSIKLNGKEVASSYQPSSYVELEQKHWKAGDVVEIDMPFSKHIEYGADKLSSDVASMDGTPLKTSWVGTLMYGPLVMTGTGAQTWNQATLDVDSKLSKVTVGESNGVMTGAGANLLTLKMDGKEFQPDYYRNANSTHYYRINLTDAVSKKSKKAKIDFTELNSLLNLAQQRKADQEKWNALSQKVPEYAPWAPYGYERMGMGGVAVNEKTTRDTLSFAYMRGDSLALTDGRGNVQGYRRSKDARSVNAKAHAAAQKLSDKLKQELK